MVGEIALPETVRLTLGALDRNRVLHERSSQHLYSGKKVNDVTDDAARFFRERELTNAAASFETYISDIDQTLDLISTQTEALTGIETILTIAVSSIRRAKNASDIERAGITSTVNSLLTQINHLVEDATVGGRNLLRSDSVSVTVRFSDRQGSRLTIPGLGITQVGTEEHRIFNEVNGFVFEPGQPGFSRIGTAPPPLGDGFSNAVALGTGANEAIDQYTNHFVGAIRRVRFAAARFVISADILTFRKTFNKQISVGHRDGALKLTSADLNEEGANLVALQARRELGIESLRSYKRDQDSVLSLLRR